MGPMVPEESASRLLEDDVLVLVAAASGLAGQMPPVLVDSIGDLVRSMNCYYSNLIEGHDTHPRDIDRALANDFSTEPKKRDLQKEALAHIHVQRLIDKGSGPYFYLPKMQDHLEARWEAVLPPLGFHAYPAYL